MPDAFVMTWLFVVGAVVGSFLNVVIHRVPRRRSIVSPGSACPECATPIRWYDNIPILSWIILRARCRSCAARIPVRYPLIELAGGLIPVLAALRHPLEVAPAVETALLAWIALALAVIDCEHQILPDVITYPTIVLGLAFSFLGGLAGPFDALLGAVVGAGLPALVIGLYKLVRGVEGMGWGDVKYLAGIGAAIGLAGCLWVLVAAAMAGALVGVVLIVAGRGSARTALPFGTFLSVALVAWLYLPDAWRVWSLW